MALSWQIVRADARALPLADGSVDLIVTSPPYWGLRSYRDGGEHYSGQVGSESTPQQFVEVLVSMIDAEWRRVLKPSGSMFLNLGDKYAGSGGPGTVTSYLQHPQQERTGGIGAYYRQGTDLAPRKSLLGLPWRIALALIDLGWILRAEIVWSKPNGLPESVQDRVRRSHEQVFHFVLEPRYFSAVDEIRDEYALSTLAIYETGRDPRNKKARAAGIASQGPMRGEWDDTWRGNPLGRLPGSVWTIPTQPLIVPDAVKEHYDLPDHFAAYPPELVRRIVLAWSPEKVCTACGQGRRPVVAVGYEDAGGAGEYERRRDEGKKIGDATNPGPQAMRLGRANRLTTIVGEACACPDTTAPTTPGVVLDPMCGTGTTVGVAHKLGRHGIGVDLSADYCRLAEWRIEHSGHFDRVEDRTYSERQETLL